MAHPYRIDLPEEIIRLAEQCLLRSGLYPDPESLIVESVMRLHVTVNSHGPGSIRDDVERFRFDVIGKPIPVDVRIAESTFRNVTRLSESLGVNLFAVAVMAQLDRLHQLPA